MADFKSITLQGQEIFCKDETARELAQVALDKVDNFTSFAPLRGDTAAWIGDSWGAGNGVTSGQAYPERVSARLGLDSENYSVGGSGFIRKAGGTGMTFSDQLDEAIADNPTKKFKYVFVMGGFNDINHGSMGSELYTAQQEFIRKIRDNLPDAIIVWCGFNLRCYEVTRDFRDGYDYSHNSIMIAAENPVIIVNNWQWSLVGKSQYYNSDGVHPNNTGHLIISNAIVAALLGQNIEYRLMLSRPEITNGSLWSELNPRSDEFWVEQKNGEIEIHFPTFDCPAGFTGAFIQSDYTLPASARPANPQTFPIYTSNTALDLFLMIDPSGVMYIQNKPSTDNVPANASLHPPVARYPMYSPEP